MIKVSTYIQLKPDTLAPRFTTLCNTAYDLSPEIAEHKCKSLKISISPIARNLEVVLVKYGGFTRGVCTLSAILTLRCIIQSFRRHKM